MEICFYQFCRVIYMVLRQRGFFFKNILILTISSSQSYTNRIFRNLINLVSCCLVNTGFKYVNIHPVTFIVYIIHGINKCFQNDQCGLHFYK